MIYGFNNKKETVDLLDFFYPVGSIYDTADASFDPNAVWGGTWEQINGKFLLASDSGHAVGTTGGAASASYTPSGSVGGHTLTVDEIPAHNHSVNLATFNVDTITDNGGTGIEVNVAANPAAGSTGNKGGGTAHSHGFAGTAATIATMPPFEAVNVWKRTL